MAETTDFTVSISRLNNINSQKKRRTNYESWADVSRKRNKNLGLEYTSRNEVVHEGIEPPNGEPHCGPRCTKEGCWLPLDRIYELFRQFWSSGSYSMQTAMLLRLIRRLPVKKRTTADQQQSRRTATFKYFLLDNDGFELEVCKNTFLSTFAITRGRLDVLHDKMRTGELMFYDNRGRHDNRPSRLPENVRDAINEHIDSFPLYLSHYTRGHGDPLRRYLEPGLTVGIMFELFVSAYGEEASNWIWVYRKILLERGLRFGQPKTDTCSKCEKFKVDIDGLPVTEENQEHLENLWTERIEHQLCAESGYETMRADKRRSQNDDDYISLSIDLQGALFSPVLTNPEYFYLRKYTTHNLAIVDNATDTATMSVWHSVEGNKGSCEVASSLLRYCIERFAPLEDGQIRHLVIWSDRSSGQNNNQYLIILLRYLLALNLFTTVEQKFLTTGHTFLSADRQFALIENLKRKSKIYRPDDYLDVIRNANKAHPSSIQKMNLNDFKNFEELRPYFSMPRTLKVTQVKVLRLERNRPNIISTKVEVADIEWTEHVVTRSQPMENLVLRDMYQEFITLPQPLVNDLKKLRQWIPVQFRNDWAFLDEYPI